MALLTDQSLTPFVSLSDFVHIVNPNDISQNPAGSSFKATVFQVAQSIGTAAFSGGSVSYPTIFTSGLTANTFSATTYLNLPGGSSGNCLSDFYVSTIHSCSPLYVNPLNEGNVIFGNSNQLYLDITNKKVGINRIPTYTLDIQGNNSGRLFFREGTGNAQLTISGDTNDLSAFKLFMESSEFTINHIGINYSGTFNGISSGDTLITNSSQAGNLYFQTESGGLFNKDIKFYAGRSINTKPDLVIKGTGTTQGYIGINTNNPTEQLDVDGKTIVRDGLTASTINISSTPTTETSLGANYLTRDSSTGNVKVKTIPGPIAYGQFAQTGNSTVISATTVESTLINGGIGTLSVPANAFSIGDSFRVVMGGVLNAVNGETVRIRVKTGSVILLDSLAQTVPAITNDIFNMTINFTIRNIGVVGVASIASLGEFHYAKVNDNTVRGFAFNTVNNTTFDTTISNTLDITVQFGSNNTGNSIYSDIFILNKVF